MPTPFIAPEAITEVDLTIRSYQPGDGPALCAGKRASYEHLRPWMPWARPDDSDDECEAQVRHFCGKYLQGIDFVLSIWLAGPEGPQFAGGTGFHLRGQDLAVGVADIGMWIVAPLAGQGLGTRSLRLMLRWGFTEWAWQRLTWHCDSRNLASARTAEKAGMRLEGTMRRNFLDVHGERRDTCIYAMLKDDWPVQPADAG